MEGHGELGKIYEMIFQKVSLSQREYEKVTEDIRDHCLKRAKGKADNYADCAKDYWKTLERESRLFTLKTEFETKKAKECLSKGSDAKNNQVCRENTLKAVDSHIKSYLESLSKITS